ncbi:putative amidoligase domain-containing protein [Paenibacillus flagellatus]|uniref:Phage phiEco32-like COOH-NH2 ligase-type 2 n=1 Tax=Paenibacillus flagellatus TaxID=2211139 RepID=A0A2V5K8U4_9BACL|nr:hypothetical protein [Paenibacillus flagellatus]PYI55939.1 hypothetical protein DLM86_09530 [Paenibacillus flagellatus]
MDGNVAVRGGTRPAPALKGPEDDPAAVAPERIGLALDALGYRDRADGGETGSASRRYRFALYHLETIAAERYASNTVFVSRALGGRPPGRSERLWEPVEAGSADRALRRAERAAARLLYACGLDAGAVELGTDAAGRPVFAAIEPLPAGNGKLDAALAAARERFLAGWEAERTRTSPATLGADPEFLLANADGRVVPASAYLPKRGRAGCDVVRIGDRVLYPLAELRPEPSADPARLIMHIRRGLLAAARHIPDTPGVKWLAGGMPARGFALGGHIHMSGLWLNVRLLRALDNYVALPLALLEDDRAAARRPRYGTPGDFRRQPHGGFEYRTLPSWLVSPRVAKGVLALAALVSSHYASLPRTPLHDPEMLRAYMRGDKPPLRVAAAPLPGDVRRLPEYERYAAWIEPLYAMMEAGESWDESRDIRAGWKIEASPSRTR